MKFALPKIYPITDVRLAGISHTAQIEHLAAGGAELIQLREKLAPSGEFFRSAQEAMEIAREKGIRIILNDRLDIALMAGADGVHLGQDDLPPEGARKMLGDDAVIGISTHNVEQARSAIAMPIDYIATGPIFPTKTKENPDDVVGLDGLRRVRDAIGHRPLVAIGGITIENIRSVFDAGADCVAVIGALYADPDKIADKLREFIDTVRSY